MTTPASRDHLTREGLAQIRATRLMHGDLARAVITAEWGWDEHDRAERLAAEVGAFTQWRDSMAADLPDEYREEGAAVEVGIEDAYVDGLAARAALAALIADLRAEAARLSTHDVDACTHECDSPYCFGCADCAARITVDAFVRVLDRHAGAES